jgi:hypothetical protein
MKLQLPLPPSASTAQEQTPSAPSCEPVAKPAVQKLTLSPPTEKELATLLVEMNTIQDQADRRVEAWLNKCSDWVDRLKSD